ncbi:MAG: glutamate 5-kinase, partial [Cohaesibacter sp.]|nr:glutamate 5-kinase [Cohaesibacter sp.]
MASADALILFSQDIDGLYTADPSEDPSAEHIPTVSELTNQIEGMAGESHGHGTGGMVTKLAAAHICMSAGCHMAIAKGRTIFPVKALLEGARCTWFIPEDEPQTARQRWISGIIAPSGTLTIDDGALRALDSGKSLLPIGVTKVSGTFDRGDVVVVQNAAGQELARGLSAYDSNDAQMIIGHKTQDIEDLLGYRGRSELIHR